MIITYSHEYTNDLKFVSDQKTDSMDLTEAQIIWLLDARTKRIYDLCGLGLGNVTQLVLLLDQNC